MRPLAGLTPEQLRRAMALWDALQDEPAADADARLEALAEASPEVVAAVRAMREIGRAHV